MPLSGPRLDPFGGNGSSALCRMSESILELDANDHTEG